MDGALLMCACDSDFTCGACKDTPQDGRYFLDEPDELTPTEFDKLCDSREPDGSWQAWA